MMEKRIAQLGIGEVGPEPLRTRHLPEEEEEETMIDGTAVAAAAADSIVTKPPGKDTEETETGTEEVRN